ncbi:hypothetical protein CCR85_04730 [Rhodothalassium salexigens]|uniref:Putative photosynthetic complex assembly protein 2 n=1 Tax=Rhodothalassium salexigens DSM 2132 TaxID=1188247 RepID=A0A4R2PJ23_RHOSA|nr:putative photosynthetic complex assembly protein PuhE [Rhodothalassium salexigens]MBB4211406.1 putative photosynthetic complex assembly protein 2 [Rhodothalassium salexigens DSM 2132]MBK1637739.1 hypothetical protein [Rhodothalassium salexigens DSM 2132]MBK5910798.1 hypothetical protein [Rhodothalassium salexigens]MBK5920544.1 hypothetical protein [Rhodothalassium salexigens]TCP35327.1 putative photosynthetic complex assembly protein 2 [Rhodothalassium salexigens DSM 2132]
MDMPAMLSHPLVIVGYAVFLWWFSTGLILYLNRRPRWTFKWSLAGGTLLFAGALLGLDWSAEATTPAALFCSFSCGLIAWGWQELTFYLGYLTGPRKHRCAPGCSGWRHFGHALQISKYHEISIVVTGVVIAAITWGSPNQLALLTFMLVMVMHQSARINVFLGVRNVSEDWVAPHMDFLKSFLRVRPMNPFFPVSQVVAGAAEYWLVTEAMAAPAGSATAISYTFLAAMLGLAMIEHWFLVLPLPLAGLWNCFHRSESPERPASKARDVRHEYAEKNPLAPYPEPCRAGCKDAGLLPRIAPDSPGRTS